MNKEEFYKKIEEKEKDNNKKDPCLHCEPGNGCDDCRGCSYAKISHKLYIELKKLKDEYKKKFSSDYDKDKRKKDFERIIKYWTDELDKINQICKDCHGNTMDDCMYCGTLDKKLSYSRSLKTCKEEYMKEFNEEYDWQDSFALTTGTQEQRDFYKEKLGYMETKNKKSFIISAEEARKMLEKEIEKDEACLEPIMELISKAIKRKDNYCYINDKPEYVLSKLRKLGYTVSDLMKGDSCREPDCRKISW